jgi:hypothetical protein
VAIEWGRSAGSTAASVGDHLGERGGGLVVAPGSGQRLDSHGGDAGDSFARCVHRFEPWEQLGEPTPCPAHVVEQDAGEEEQVAEFAACGRVEQLAHCALGTGDEAVAEREVRVGDDGSEAGFDEAMLLGDGVKSPEGVAGRGSVAALNAADEPGVEHLRGERGFVDVG